MLDLLGTLLYSTLEHHGTLTTALGMVESQNQVVPMQANRDDRVPHVIEFYLLIPIAVLFHIYI